MNIRHQFKKLLIKTGYKSEPDFLIIGAQKAGTTLLYSYLSLHPEIGRPVNKEAHFFDRDENYRAGYDFYYKNFPLPLWVKNKKNFEATPDYLHDPIVPKRIKKKYPNIKMIIVLRDPVKRAFSAWNMHHSLFPNLKNYAHLEDNRTFSEVIEEDLNGNLEERSILKHVNRGKYVQQIQRYFELFDTNQFLILEDVELKTNLQGTLNKICAFINVSQLKLKEYNYSEIFWDNKGRYARKMSTREEVVLREYYKPYDIELEKLLKQSFSWFTH